MTNQRSKIRDTGPFLRNEFIPDKRIVRIALEQLSTAEMIPFVRRSNEDHAVAFPEIAISPAILFRVGSIGAWRGIVAHVRFEWGCT